MRYTVRTSVINVLGYMWMPRVEAATQYTLSAYDVGNAKDDDGKLTRESVQRWVDTHAGDFSEVTDWHASLEDEDDTVEIPWADDNNEYTWGGLMYPEEDDWDE